MTLLQRPSSTLQVQPARSAREQTRLVLDGRSFLLDPSEDVARIQQETLLAAAGRPAYLCFRIATGTTVRALITATSRLHLETIVLDDLEEEAGENPPPSHDFDLDLDLGL